MTRVALDVHAHLLPVFPEKLARFSGIGRDAAAKKLSIDGHAVSIPRLFQPAELAAWMTEQGVAHVWISALPPAYRMHLRGAGALDWARHLNDALDEAAADYAGAMFRLYHLPMQDPGPPAGSSKNRGLRGTVFSLCPRTGDERKLSDAEFDGLWS